MDLINHPYDFTGILKPILLNYLNAVLIIVITYILLNIYAIVKLVKET